MQDLVITNAGQDLMTKLIAGETTAKFTSLQTSSHVYTIGDLATLESLEDVKQTTLVSGVSVTDSKTVQVFTRVDNTSVQEAYYINTIGLIAEDGEGNSILYAVSIADEHPDWMPAYVSGETPTGYSYTFNVKVSNSSSVVISVNPAATPTIEMFEAAVNKVDTIETDLGDTDISDIEDGTIKTILKLVYKKAILGKTAAERNGFVVIKDISDEMYATNSALRARVAAGDFTDLNPGNYIIGKTTGTKYWTVDIDYWYGNRTSGYGQTNYAESTHHLAIMPQQLIGVSELLWAGQLWTGDATINTVQGCAPWQATAGSRTGVGQNDTTGAYHNSYIRNTVLPKVYRYWLKADFEDHGIKVLSFYNLETNTINTSASCKGYSAWAGASSSWAWYDSSDNSAVKKCTLPSIQNLTGGDGFESSGYDAGVQKEQLAIFKAGMSYQDFLGDIANTQYARHTWTKNVASSAGACGVYDTGSSHANAASLALGVRPLAFIA
ncbi:MAG: hypothetical protein E7273_13400 [Pseudobutyrivibrio ruminis]|nr:hypothetical protein [Pseudobutyrivibrio ruminis]